MLTTIILLLISLAGITISFLYFRKNLRHIAQKNATEPSSFKRAMNYPLTIIWYAYLIIFFAGVFINNVFLK